MSLNVRNVSALFAFGIVALVAVSAFGIAQGQGNGVKDGTGPKTNCSGFGNGTIECNETGSKAMAPNSIASWGNVKGIKAMVNGTYRSCVSDITRQKNSCYRETKSLLKDCKSNVERASVRNKTLYRQMNSGCLSLYKEVVGTCKMEFKEAKVQCKALGK